MARQNMNLQLTATGELRAPGGLPLRIPFRRQQP